MAATGAAVGDSVKAIGWGATRNFGQPVHKLSYAPDLVIVEDEEADIFTEPLPPYEQIICTYQKERGTCTGDSGEKIWITLEGSVLILQTAVCTYKK